MEGKARQAEKQRAESRNENDTLTMMQRGPLHFDNDNSERDKSRTSSSSSSSLSQEHDLENGEILPSSSPRQQQQQHHHSLFGIALIVAGSFCFSCMFLFVKLLQGVADGFTLTFYRGFVEIPLALAQCWRVGEPPWGPPSHMIRAWLWVRGGTGAAAVLCFYYAIQHLPLPDAVTLQFTTPPFAAAIAVCLAHERWLRFDMAGAVVCLVGVMLIAHPSWLFPRHDDGGSAESTTNNEKENAAAVAAADMDESTKNQEQSHPNDNHATTLAIAVALLGAALAGLAYTSVRKIGHAASANVMVLYYACLSVPVTLLGNKMFADSWNVWSGGSTLSVTDWMLVVLTGLSAYAGQYLTNWGLQHETAATGTLATCSQIVFTYGFELTFLHEPLNGWSIAGSVLIVSFMTAVGILKMRNADETIHETVAGETEGLGLMVSAERNVQHHRYDGGDNDNKEEGQYIMTALPCHDDDDDNNKD